MASLHMASISGRARESSSNNVTHKSHTIERESERERAGISSIDTQSENGDWTPQLSAGTMPNESGSRSSPSGAAIFLVSNRCSDRER